MVKVQYALWWLYIKSMDSEAEGLYNAMGVHTLSVNMSESAQPMFGLLIAWASSTGIMAEGPFYHHHREQLRQVIILKLFGWNH